MGHIQLSRASDLVLVCPATADLIARMAAGIANDWRPPCCWRRTSWSVAPAMNVRMWQHSATKRNVEQLKADGITVLDPDEGPMACGEYGPGRLPNQRIYSRGSSRYLARQLLLRRVIRTAGWQAHPDHGRPYP